MPSCFLLCHAVQRTTRTNDELLEDGWISAEDLISTEDDRIGASDEVFGANEGVSRSGSNPVDGFTDSFGATDDDFSGSNTMMVESGELVVSRGKDGVGKEELSTWDELIGKEEAASVD